MKKVAKNAIPISPMKTIIGVSLGLISATNDAEIASNLANIPVAEYANDKNSGSKHSR